MRLGVVGAAGRMGRALIRAIHDHDGVTLGAATERPGLGMKGADAGALAGVGSLGVEVLHDASAFAECDAVLDFTAPEASAALAEALAALGTRHVIGTTGFSDEEEARIVAASDEIAILKSGNMSLGVNLLAALVRRASAALPGADIEVCEMHHRRKVDAPSGTAYLLGEAAAEGRGVALRDYAILAREGHTGPRPAGSIGFATLRGGTVVGEHDVVFALDAERIVLSHKAEDRSLFANGAVTGALWLEGKPPGLYAMSDVLGLD